MIIGSTEIIMTLLIIFCLAVAVLFLKIISKFKKN